MNNKVMFPIGIGTSAVCFKKGNEVLKLFYDNFGDNNDITDILIKLMSLKNNTFIVPNEILIKKDKLAGYSYNYINANKLCDYNDSILDILTHYDILIEDTIKLSNMGINIYDLNKNNILFDKYFHIIDLDRYYTDNNSVEDIIRKNIIDVNDNIIKSIFNIGVDTKYSFKIDKLNKLYGLLIKDYNNLPDMLNELCDISKSDNIKLIRRNIDVDKYVNYYNRY